MKLLTRLVSDDRVFGGTYYCPYPLSYIKHQCSKGNNSYRAVNTLNLGYKNRPVNVV
jgi:hypothetical protein